MTEYEFHPIANIFPMMSEDGLWDLANDMKTNGQHQPIILFEGKILDGRNRYRACRLAGIEPVCVSTENSDPIGFVLSHNLHRRHLTPSQKAMVADKVRDYFDAQAKKRQKDHGGTSPGKANENTCGNISTSVSGRARDQAGATVGVSGRTVDKATKVRKEGVPKLAEAVEEGKVNLSQAEKVAVLPTDCQTHIVEQIEAGTKPAEAIRQATATVTEVILDGDKRPVPPHLRDIFLGAERFRRWSRQLSGIKAEIKSAMDEDERLFAQFCETAFAIKLTTAASQLRLSAPYLVCPYCGGTESKNCTGCRGAGFLSKAQARCVPQEMRLREDAPEATESANAGGLG